MQRNPAKKSRAQLLIYPAFPSNAKLSRPPNTRDGIKSQSAVCPNICVRRAAQLQDLWTLAVWRTWQEESNSSDRRFLSAMDGKDSRRCCEGYEICAGTDHEVEVLMPSVRLWLPIGFRCQSSVA